MSPTRSFGNLQFKQEPNPVDGWSQYLSSLSNQQDVDALGLGTVENDATKDEAWNRWMSMNAGSLSPNAQKGLASNRWQINSAFNQARASQPNVRYAQFLGGVAPTDTVNAWSPQTANRPVMFHRIRSSFN